MATSPYNQNATVVDGALSPSGALSTTTPTTPSQSNYKGSYAQTVGYNTTPAPTKPTPTVGSGTAVNQFNTIKSTVDTSNQNNSNTYDATNPNKTDANGLLYNPVGAIFDRNTGLNLKTGQPPVQPTTTTETKPQPQTLESAQVDAINNPNGEKPFFNNTTGASENKVPNPDGTPPTGYSTQDPKTRTDVTNTATDTNGVQYKQFTDGTYG